MSKEQLSDKPVKLTQEQIAILKNNSGPSFGGGNWMGFYQQVRGGTTSDLRENASKPENHSLLFPGKMGI